MQLSIPSLSLNLDGTAEDPGSDTLVLSDVHVGDGKGIEDGDSVDCVYKWFSFTLPSQASPSESDDDMKEEPAVKRRKIDVGGVYHYDTDGDAIITRRRGKVKERRSKRYKIRYKRGTEIDLVGLQVWTGSLLMCDFLIHAFLGGGDSTSPSHTAFSSSSSLPDIIQSERIAFVDIGAGSGLTSIVLRDLIKVVTKGRSKSEDGRFLSPCLSSSASIPDSHESAIPNEGDARNDIICSGSDPLARDGVTLKLDECVRRIKTSSTSSVIYATDYTPIILENMKVNVSFNLREDSDEEDILTVKRLDLHHVSDSHGTTCISPEALSSDTIAGHEDRTNQSLPQEVYPSLEECLHLHSQDLLDYNHVIFIASDIIYGKDLTDSFFTYLSCLSSSIHWTAYIALEKRINFSLARMEVLSEQYDYFLSYLCTSEVCIQSKKDKKEGDSSTTISVACPFRFKGSRLSSGDIPTYSHDYIKNSYLELWEITKHTS